jgi:hypothetical protein
MRAGQVRVFDDVKSTTVKSFGNCCQIGGCAMACTVRRPGVKKASLSKIKDVLSR